MSGDWLGRWVVGLAVVAAALFALLSGPETPPPLGRGRPAPDFELPLLGGEERRALSDHRGRVVLINFWATWCKPCEDEMPAIERLYRALQGGRFELLAVSVDESEDPVRDFSQQLGLSFPILMDSQQTVSRSYQTFRYPESFLVGPDGVVIERYVGPREWDAPVYVERIRRLLEKSDAAAGV